MIDLNAIYNFLQPLRETSPCARVAYQCRELFQATPSIGDIKGKHGLTSITGVLATMSVPIPGT